MKKRYSIPTIFNLFAFLFSIAAPTSLAFAKDIDLLLVKAEKYPQDNYYIGVTVDSQNQITGLNMHYVDGAKYNYTPFPVDKLIKGAVMISVVGPKVMSKGDRVYELVRLQMGANSQNQTNVVKFSYMRDGLTEKYNNQKVAIVWDAQAATYRVVDANGNRVNYAYVSTNYWFGMEVGIGAIDFSWVN